MMKWSVALSAMLCCAGTGWTQTARDTQMLPQVNVRAASTANPDASPPIADVENAETDYFGTKVRDAYRWMEKSADDPRLKEFLTGQDNYVRAQLISLPGRAKMLERVRQLSTAIPRLHRWRRLAGKIFYLTASASEEVESLMVRDAGGRPRKLFDPRRFDQKDSHATIDFYSPSRDGKYVVIGVALGGSENAITHVLEVKTGRLLPDEISRTQFSDISWRSDSRSFYYDRMQPLPPGAPASETFHNQKTYLHVLGRNPDDDPAVLGPGMNSKTAEFPKDGLYGVASVPGCPYALGFHTLGNGDPVSVYLAPVEQVQDDSTPWRQIVTGEAEIAPDVDAPVTVHASTLYFLSQKNAPNRKIVSFNLDHADMAHASEVRDPGKDMQLLGLYAAKDGLYLETQHGVAFELWVSGYDHPGQWKKVPTPFAGTMSNIATNPTLPGVMFRLESWTHSDESLLYDPLTNRTSNTGLLEKNPADYGQIIAEELEVESTDGAKVPVSVLHRKGLALDGSNPTWLNVYGGYGISLDPYFYSPYLAWLEQGGIIAHVHARGGGEYGKSWHDAGRRENKQHTIDDVIAAARYLIERRYTSPQHLSVWGDSAGGIASGGALVQHPELFSSATIYAGVTDLLLFQNTLIGPINVPELGDAQNRHDFNFMFGVSPYHHIVDGVAYPAVMAIDGTNDPRVPIWMSAKFIARLQAATSNHNRPILLRVDFDAGHGFGSTRSQLMEMLVDRWSFMLWQSGDARFQPEKPSREK
jgi:prolyl oligopeptidase